MSNQTKEHSKGVSRIISRFDEVRARFMKLCEPLEVEDYVIQAIEDVSPPKWHLAHTTWFFERVILQNYQPGYEPFDPAYYHLFNSYYNSFEDQALRRARGTLSRPTVAEVKLYRQVIEDRMREFMTNLDELNAPEILKLIELGLNHEEQHQELMLCDTKWNLGSNPLYPAYRPTDGPSGRQASDLSELSWVGFDGGLKEIGHSGDRFSFDNERPVHKYYLQPFELSNRLISSGEYLEFMEAGGYKTPQLWLDDGWTAVNRNGWSAPAHWHKIDGSWQVFTLNGLRPIDLAEPVCHVSFLEAEAFARWAGGRLPTEYEWESAARTVSGSNSGGNFLEANYLHPNPPLGDASGLRQMFGDVWEWTSSAYLPYPGYHQAEGALGEYNGKFMNGQRVARGGSCVTPRDHARLTYRNFFQPDKRWVLLGFRLAR